MRVKVDVHHLTRVEGHGNIRIRILDGKVEEARWQVVETPRFFEAILQGKHHSSAAILTARICGICSIGHCLASVRATEAAFGVEVPPLAAKLRLLAKHGETLQSHVLHLLFLAAPDLLGLDSAIPLVQLRPELFALAARLKGVGNALCDTVAGRTTHPVSITVGGMAQRPEKRTLRGLAGELKGAIEDLGAVARLLAGLPLPEFVRETEFVSLKGEGGYPWIGGRLLSTDGVELPEGDYLRMTNEYLVEGESSKWCRLSRPSFAVGALARFNNNSRFLHPSALEAAEAFGLRAPCHNPFLNNVAQLVEAIHVTHESMALVEEILAAAADAPIATQVVARAGEGVGAVEVPRGILYHHYRYDEDGRVAKANCIIPTTQNNANIQLDIRRLAEVEGLSGTSDEKLTLLASMLVRSYDPCISCSVH
jgi:sulfhydrogenase subunit alpha